MFFFVDVMHGGDCILAMYNGEPTREDLEAARSSAQKLLEKYGCRKLLIDIAPMLRLNIAVENIYRFVESLNGIPSDVKIGVVIPPEQRWFAEFTEKIAANRGVHLKVHTNNEPARLWLMSDSGTNDKAENNESP